MNDRVPIAQCPPDARRGASARLRAQERGAELVEFALALPLLLVVFGGIIDFGLLLQRHQVLSNAAREGARLAVLPGYTTGATCRRGSSAYVREGIADNTAHAGDDRWRT